MQTARRFLIGVSFQLGTMKFVGGSPFCCSHASNSFLGIKERLTARIIIDLDRALSCSICFLTLDWTSFFSFVFGLVNTIKDTGLFHISKDIRDHADICRYLNYSYRIIF